LHTGEIAETDVGVEEKDFNARTEEYTQENEEDDDDGCGESLAIALPHWFLFFLPNSSAKQSTLGRLFRLL
jgi:hypothetical protein